MDKKENKMIFPCWILPSGEIINCPRWGDHRNAAELRLETDDIFDAEQLAEIRVWIKIMFLGGNDFKVIGLKQSTPKQIIVLKKMNAYHLLNVLKMR